MSAVALAAAERQPSRWKADVALAVVALCWGTTFVIVKRAIGSVSVSYFLFLRFSVASLCMLILFAPAFRRAGLKTFWRGFRSGLVAGLFLWLGYLLQTIGLRYTSAGNSGFITGLYIVFVPLISAAFCRRRPNKLELTGIFIASVGMAVLGAPSLDRHLRMNLGDALTLACAVAYAFHLLILGYFSQRELFEGVALGQIVCTAALSALSLLYEPPRAAWSPEVVLAILVTAVFATALSFTLQTWAQQYTTATRTALIFALEPVFALVTAVAIGGENLRWTQVCGGSLILAGILRVELKPAQVESHRNTNQYG